MKIGRTLSEVAAEIERQAGPSRITSRTPVSSASTTMGTLSRSTATVASRRRTWPSRRSVPTPASRCPTCAGCKPRPPSCSPAMSIIGFRPSLPSAGTDARWRRQGLPSSRYARIDNLEVAETVLPVSPRWSEARRDGGGRFGSHREPPISRRSSQAFGPRSPNPPRRRHRRSRHPDLEQEVGLGAVSVKPFARFLACLNGMTRDGGGAWKHVGRRADESEEIYALLTDEPGRPTIRRFLKVRDTVAATLDKRRFDASDPEDPEHDRRSDRGRRTGRGRSVGEDPLAAPGREEFGIAASDRRRRPLALRSENAVTRTAEDTLSYDRATELKP